MAANCPFRCDGQHHRTERLRQLDADQRSGLLPVHGLCPGTYSVSVVTPAGYALTPVLSNDPNTDFDANNTPQAVVSNNNTNNTIDFGFYLICDGKIGNYVWIDANKNGIQDGGELPLSGVTVNITGPNGYNNSMPTNGAGFYQFTDLCPAPTRSPS